jgi:hypothetical protein
MRGSMKFYEIASHFLKMCLRSKGRNRPTCKLGDSFKVIVNIKGVVWSGGDETVSGYVPLMDFC